MLSRLERIKWVNCANFTTYYFTLLLSFFQAVELRSYFKSLGAEITLEGSEKGIEDDLHKIIGVCDACFKDQPNANPSEIEEVFNGIVSMLALVRLTTHSF